MLDKYIKHEVREIIVYLFIGIVVVFILPLLAGFSLRGFEESLVSGVINISDYLGTYLLYLFFMIIGLFVIIFPTASLLTIKEGEHPATQQPVSWFRIFTVSLIFNPQDGALWQISKALGLKDKKNFMRWSNNILRTIIVGILLFGALGLVQVGHPEFNVVGVPSGEHLAQQITPSSDVIFGSAIPSFAENGFLLFILFFFLGINAYLCARFIKDPKTALIVFFLIAIFVISPLMGAIWASIHTLVYGNSDAKLFQTWVFATMGSILTILTGLMIWFFLHHFFNTFAIKMSEIVTNTEDIIFIGIISLSVLLFLWIAGEIYFWQRRKRNRGKVYVPS